MPGGDVMMAPIEELVADRYMQWDASCRCDGEFNAQIAALLSLAEHLDED
jgi:hypothetical protein